MSLFGTSPVITLKNLITLIKSKRNEVLRLILLRIERNQPLVVTFGWYSCNTKSQRKKDKVSLRIQESEKMKIESQIYATRDEIEEDLLKDSLLFQLIEFKLKILSEGKRRTRKDSGDD